ncbi:RNA polymerase sigma-70 factor (ECF subfamily) [Brevundimonas vesicularis]|uniref:RNA polymerase sigma-70 factor (ECF subfamily) n=1 Tax=Brevundimonas vesicularis TaxID=41276 RepID=A0A7W9FR92_BREVE|nr:sigma-70 family RNA polymerase sigma factor [Brevundimonas vesicularis]MBB5770048.1 RNA polymerase sigma-70 factor (ECF subfamily) [Brevundimonas vesicularis]
MSLRVSSTNFDGNGLATHRPLEGKSVIHGGGKSEHARVRWLGQEILPHEQDVRAWLRRSLVTSNDVDDVIQESYCRLANLKAVEQIESPRAYFFQTARSVVLEQMRRARIVRIDAVTEIDALRIEWDEPSPERIAGGRKELERVMKIVATLPERSRRIFEMRRVMGLSQKEIARQLGVSENVVENEAARGLKAVLAGLAQADANVAPSSTGERRA